MSHPDTVEILLVEDNPNDLRLTQRALAKVRLGGRIEVVRDGEEALNYLFGEGLFVGRNVADTPKLVLLDLKLPKIDGIDVLRRIRADPRTRCIPVVVLSSSKEQRDVVEAYRLGVNSYIVKPVDYESFSSAVQELGMYWLLLNRSPRLED
jgi:two-component system, response regulator